MIFEKSSFRQPYMAAIETENHISSEIFQINGYIKGIVAVAVYHSLPRYCTSAQKEVLRSTLSCNAVP